MKPELGPEALAARTRAAGMQPPPLAASLVRGMLGFTFVSVAGFVPWAVFGRWFYRHLGEAGLYGVCALVFIGLSAPVMHRLIMGPGSMSRFFKVFSVAFAAYSVAWIGGWMALRDHPGSLAGLFFGTLVMAAILAAAFRAWNQFLKVLAALFLLNSAGYFLGGVVEGALIRQHALTAKLLWGVFYGLGFGAGLGLAFHVCQTRARALLKA